MVQQIREQAAQVLAVLCQIVELAQSPVGIVIEDGIRQGEQLTLRVVAKHADAWNFPYPDVEQFKRLNGILDGYCAEIGRDPASTRGRQGRGTWVVSLNSRTDAPPSR